MKKRILTALCVLVLTFFTLSTAMAEIPEPEEGTLHIPGEFVPVFELTDDDFIDEIERAFGETHTMPENINAPKTSDIVTVDDSGTIFVTTNGCMLSMPFIWGHNFYTQDLNASYDNAYYLMKPDAAVNLAKVLIDEDVHLYAQLYVSEFSVLIGEDSLGAAAYLNRYYPDFSNIPDADKKQAVSILSWQMGVPVGFESFNGETYLLLDLSTYGYKLYQRPVNGKFLTIRISYPDLTEKIDPYILGDVMQAFGCK